MFSYAILICLSSILAFASGFGRFGACLTLCGPYMKLRSDYAGLHGRAVEMGAVGSGDLVRDVLPEGAPLPEGVDPRMLDENGNLRPEFKGIPWDCLFPILQLGRGCLNIINSIDPVFTSPDDAAPKDVSNGPIRYDNAGNALQIVTSGAGAVKAVSDVATALG